MIDKTVFNALLGIKENFEMPTKLLEILKDKARRTALFDELLKHIDNLSVDILRDYFQAEQGDRKSLKQDYTPDCVCNIINRLSSDSGSSGDSEIIYDMCAGSGALTIAKYKDSRDSIFYCDEISANVLPVLILNLAIRNINAVVRKRDVLTEETFEVYRLTKGEKYSDIEEAETAEMPKVSVVISNPPYSLKFENAESYADDERFKDYGLLPKSKADYAFVLDGLSRLNDKGSAFFILPHGVLFRGNKEGEIRKKLVENNLIDSIIGLPDNLFMNTSIPVFVLVLKKNRADKNILFIDASKDFYKNAKVNDMKPEHIDKLISVYKNRLECNKYSHLANLEEIKANDFNLNIPRYVDTYEGKEKINIGETIKSLMGIEADIAKTRCKLAGVMGELVCNDENEAEEFYNGVKAMQEYHLYDMRTLWDIGKVEKGQQGKIYPEGSIFIMLSGISNAGLEQIVKYCNKPTKVERHCCVVIPDEKYNSYYIYQSILNVYEEFLARYKTTINLQFDTLKKLQFGVHRSRHTQNNIASELMLRDMEIKREQEQIEMWEKIKAYYMDGMFATIENALNGGAKK